MGWHPHRHRSAFAVGLGVGLLAMAAFSLLVPTLAVPGSDLGTPRPFSSNETLGAKPTMGWNSWNQFACGGLDETLVKETADSMVSSGLLAAGYDTLTLDDCWSAVSRDRSGNLTNDPAKFPSGMKAIGDYLHSRGLRYGIYASIGTSTCTGHTAGSLDHELQDVATFASWGVDYVKADRCNADGLVMKDIYARWRDAIVASGRPILLSASDNTPVDEPWAWGPITAHQWRMSGDIQDNWATMINIFDQNAAHAAATVPGAFNDPDMLEVGNGGMTDTEYRTHLGLWALMSAPLIAGNDVRNMGLSVRSILTNPEVIAVDQDSLGFQAIVASDTGNGQQVWYKPISTIGGRAVGLLNRGDAAATIGVDWASIGLRPGNATVRDVWARVDRGSFANGYSVSVPAHGLALLRIVGSDRGVTEGFLGDQPWTYMANEWGPVERNMSNGGRAAGDGRTLRLNGVTYAKGLGTRAPSALEFRPGGACSTFTADIGVDDEVGNQGSVIFQVWGDGRKRYESGVVTGANATRQISVNISGLQSLRLQVVAADSTNSDSADWANARVICTTIPNAPPHASFTVSAIRVRPGDSVTYNASASTDPDGTIRAYRWDFGDGTTGNGSIVRHAYTRSGSFRVVLTVIDDRGASASATTDIVASAANLPPIATFSASAEAAFPGISIRFDASRSTDPDGLIVSFVWDFGDGATAEGKTVNHAYSMKGNFTVRLVVKDDLGATNETTRTVAIGNRPPVIVATTPDATVILDLSEPKAFVVVAADPDGDALTFVWSVGGVRVGSLSPSYAFVRAVPGTYIVRVIASDGSAAVDFVWHVDVRERATPPPPPSSESPTTLASIGVIAIAIIVSVGVHVIGLRRRR